jgi:hypothetical protein
MAQVSIVTAARRAAAAAEEHGPAAVDVLNPGAREFLPWWRLGSSVREELSLDAPEEFPASKALSVDAPEFPASPAAGTKALSVDAPEFPARPAAGTKALSVDAPEFPASPAAGTKALSVDAPEFPARPAAGTKALSVDAPEFLPSPMRKSLSVDAPQFVMTMADIGPAAAAIDATGGSNTAPQQAGVVFRTGTVSTPAPADK